VTEEDFDLSIVDLSTSIIVFHEFSGPLFDSLRKKTAKYRIYGAPVIIEAAKLTPTSSGETAALPVSKSGYPIFCRVLKGCRVAATGLKSKDELVMNGIDKAELCKTGP
jgi:hypothetical protein